MYLLRSFLDLWSILCKFNFDSINDYFFLLVSKYLVHHQSYTYYRRRHFYPLEIINAIQSKNRKKLVDIVKGPVAVGLKEEINSWSCMSISVSSVTFLYLSGRCSGVKETFA